MSESQSTSFGDSGYGTLPKWDGKNSSWTIFKMKFLSRMQALGLLDVVLHPIPNLSKSILTGTAVTTANSNSSSSSFFSSTSPSISNAELLKLTAASLPSSVTTANSNSSSSSPSSSVPSSDEADKQLKSALAEFTTHEALLKKSQKAYTLLLYILPDPIAALLQNVPMGNANAVWEILINKFESKTFASIAHAKIQFQQCKWNIMKVLMFIVLV
jgi:hypothetical protein